MGARVAAGVACSLAGCATRRATARGAEALGLVKFLLAFGERELRAAVRASKGLICHVSLTNSCRVKKISLLIYPTGRELTGRVLVGAST